MKYLLFIIAWLSIGTAAYGQQCSSWGTTTQRAVVRSRQVIQAPVIRTTTTTTYEYAPPVRMYYVTPAPTYYSVPPRTYYAVPVAAPAYVPVVVERRPYTPIRSAIRGLIRGD